MTELKTQRFIQKAENLFGSDYSYDEVTYVNAITPVIVLCEIHNHKFEQKPIHLLRGNKGCKYCSKRGLDRDDFIMLSKKVFGEDKFDYSKTEYVKFAQKIKIICQYHNTEWDQLPQAHLKGLNPCQDCNGQKSIDLARFIQKAESIHGKHRFDYSVTVENDIKNMHSKIKIKCILHNKIFKQEINSHLRPSNACPSCNNVSLRVGEKLDNILEIINKDDRFDYSMTNFQVYYPRKMDIRCKIHDITFKQTLNGHLSGKIGCTRCSRVGPSLREQELANFVEGLGFEIDKNSRKIISPKELDIYIPSKNMAIEFNGVYWHSEKYLDKNYHYDKWKQCQKAGVRLLTIWEDDWENKNHIVKSHIKHALGVSDSSKVYARETIVTLLTKDKVRVFLEQNHIQGFVNSSVYLGLIKDDEVIAVSTFTKSDKDYILSRYATSVHAIGGHSKLVKHFENNYQYNRLITFADRTFSDGGLYEKTGWVKDGEVRPDYSYIIGGLRQHKFGFRKSRFEKDPSLIFEKGLTEKELAELNDLSRIWDAGKIRYVKPKPC